ncbi:CheR family methyltransferase [Acanthopleuribacter pedis]|uniref:protein-glutamate O-methyltransferase n=1 Tax=Acanthopleuribacter pedis TaxID=442870 RepID=A0A8J7Q3I2_9BACT|nr:protein-glutamate O-methyltransferase CheR [Acanthopleuribacter pedis]
MRIKINDHEITLFCRFIYELTGIVLDESKRYLFETRLQPLLKEHRLKNYESLYRKAKKERMVEQEIVNLMTTDESYFFRDNSPFELLYHKLLPSLFDQRRGQTRPLIRIWSAAASNGQEAYSIAMVCRELLGEVNHYQIEILGTDISTKCLYRAHLARYSKFELSRGMTFDRLNRHFNKTDDGYEVKESLRKMVSFRQANLHESLTQFGMFDIIFCRNVAVYFSAEDRKRLFDRLAERCVFGGYLIIGSTENLLGYGERFERKVFQNWVYYARK